MPFIKLQVRFAGRLSGCLCALLMLCLASAALAAQAVQGVVVDAAGKPVAGAQVGSSFTLADRFAQIRVQIGYSSAPVLSDSAGAFSIPAAAISYTHALVAKGKDGTLGYTLREDSVPARIVLLPPAHLSVQVLKPFGQQHPLGADLFAGGSTVAYATVTAQPAQLLVPQGGLELTVNDTESEIARASLTLTAASPAAVRLQLQPVWWVRNAGKPAPAFTPTDLKNWPGGKPFSVPTGKWVLVNYWATWCKPCVAEMPRLIDFYRQHEAQRGRFEILAVHSPDGQSFAAIGDAYEHLLKVWGQAIPFPLLFDATGATHERWGIAAYPTTLLIDPEGKLAGPGSLEILASKLGIPAQGRGAPTQ